MSDAPPLDSSLELARELSPRRKTSTAQDVDQLVAEQLAHFSIDANSEAGRTLGRLAGHIYRANIELHQLWDVTVRELRSLDRRDRIAWSPGPEGLGGQRKQRCHLLRRDWVWRLGHGANLTWKT